MPGELTVYSDLTTRGFTLTARQRRLIVSPATKLTAADAETIRAHRDGLLRLLGVEPEQGCPLCHGGLTRDGVCQACNVCRCPCGQATCGRQYLICDACLALPWDRQPDPLSHWSHS